MKRMILELFSLPVPVVLWNYVLMKLTKQSFTFVGISSSLLLTKGLMDFLVSGFCSLFLM